MEYVIVTFPTRRRVYVDGKSYGDTNEVLRMDRMTYVFDLGKRGDYSPRSRKVTVKDTTVLRPMKIAFRRKRA